MKVVLSKKGLDSNCSSKPIVCKENKIMDFVPIPSTDDNLKYCEIEEFKDLSKFFLNGENKLFYNIDICNLDKSIEPSCHLDPQLKDYFGFGKNFRATFGQVYKAQQTLGNHNVGVDDIFLFFGWYYDEKTKQEKNILFGYMQVEAVVTIDKDNKIFVNNETCKVKDIIKKYPFLINNPHWQFKKYQHYGNNTIYISRELCSWNENIPGFGFFNYSKNLVLTDTREKLLQKTHWNIKPLKGCTIINYDNKVFNKNGDFLAPGGFGQELIIDSQNAEKWAQDLINKNVGYKNENKQTTKGN